MTTATETAQMMRDRIDYPEYQTDIGVSAAWFDSVVVPDEQERTKMLFDQVWAQAQRSAYHLGVEFIDRDQTTVTEVPPRGDGDVVRYYRISGPAKETQWAFQSRKRVQMAEDQLQEMRNRLSLQKDMHNSEMTAQRQAADRIKLAVIAESRRRKMLQEEAEDQLVATRYWGLVGWLTVVVLAILILLNVL